MKVYALWHGGVNYAHGYVETDVESFDTLADAVAAYESRRDSGYWLRQDFRYVNRDADSVLTPCAGEGSSMWLWAADPTDDRDPYPWRIVEVGPRGGTRVVSA